MKILFQSLFCFSVLCVGLNASELDSLRQAKQKALELEIYKNKEWLDLLHFGNFFNLGRKGKSEIASPHFFLSKNGKKDPKAELLATIEGFYQDIESVQVPKDFEEKISKANILLDAAVTSLPRRSSAKQDYHAICRFPARFFYLDSLLAFENLPTLKCEEFEAMRNYVNPISATLIFPSAHINSPASMFGHTFLLLNSGFIRACFLLLSTTKQMLMKIRKMGWHLHLKDCLECIREVIQSYPIMTKSKNIEMLKTAIFGSLI